MPSSPPAPPRPSTDTGTRGGEDRGDRSTGHASQDEDDAHLSAPEREDVEDRKSGSARVLHEVIRLQGDEELERPAVSLLLSGLAGGVAISVSFLAMALLQMALPDTPWRPLVTSFGYTIGFVIVVLGRMQLFTETTITAVLPVAAHPHLHNAWRLARLWVLVLGANLAGTLLVAWAAERGWIVSAEQRAAMLEVAQAFGAQDPMAVLKHGIPAGFLIASVSWLMPNSRGSEFWIVVAITYVISIGHFSHVVAGSGEAWFLWLSGHADLSHVLGGLIGPALVGNVIGGTGLFALLAHGQVRTELAGSGGSSQKA